MRGSWTIDDFIIEKKLGEGQYSKVYLAKEKNIDKSVAIKVISNKTLGTKFPVEKFQSEIKIQFKLKHDNILKLFGFFDNEEASHIVLEYCEHGEMYKDIKRCKGYTNERAATYMYQLADVLQYCSDNGIIHRDIKAENILISVTGAVKLADFGWCTKFTDNNRNTYCGTLEYVSPEVLCSQFQDEKVDIWCLGVLLYEMLTTVTPFFSFDQIELHSNIKLVKFVVPDSVNTLAKFLIINILRRNINERLTAKQIMIHPYINRYGEKTLKKCNAAFEQWASIEDKPQNNEDKWSFQADCATFDFNKENCSDIDIHENDENKKPDESYSLLKALTKKQRSKEG